MQTWSPSNLVGYTSIESEGVHVYFDKLLELENVILFKMNPVASDLPDREILVSGVQYK